MVYYSEGIVHFTIGIDGIERIQERVARIKDERVRDFRVPFRMLVDDWFRVQEEMFEGEGKVAGEGGIRAVKWEKLSPKYVEWKRKRGYSTKILQMTGKLKRILTDKNSARVTEDTLHIRPETYMVGGWNLIRLHKYGTRRMPARDPFELSKRQREKWRILLKRWVMGESVENVL